MIVPRYAGVVWWLSGAPSSLPPPTRALTHAVLGDRRCAATAVAPGTARRQPAGGSLTADRARRHRAAAGRGLGLDCGPACRHRRPARSRTRFWETGAAQRRQLLPVPRGVSPRVVLDCGPGSSPPPTRALTHAVLGDSRSAATAVTPGTARRQARGWGLDCGPSLSSPPTRALTHAVLGDSRCAATAVTPGTARRRDAGGALTADRARRHRRPARSRTRFWEIVAPLRRQLLPVPRGVSPRVVLDCGPGSSPPPTRALTHAVLGDSRCAATAVTPGTARRQARGWVLDCGPACRHRRPARSRTRFWEIVAPLRRQSLPVPRGVGTRVGLDCGPACRHRRPARSRTRFWEIVAPLRLQLLPVPRGVSPRVGP